MLSGSLETASFRSWLRSHSEILNNVSKDNHGRR
jgi:hypothetical protein